MSTNESPNTEPSHSTVPAADEASPPQRVTARAEAAIRDVTRWSREHAVTVQRRGGEVLRRTGKLAKDHPVATTAVVVGAVAIASPEVAAGVAVGVGVTVLVARPESRRQLAGWLDRGRARLSQALLRVAARVEPNRPAPDAAPAARA